MSQSDVCQLADESLSEDRFPASHTADFRVYFESDVHIAIAAHAAEDTSVEICGVLVGQWYRDADGPFARITSFIRCDDAASGETEVTFTHQSWAQINEVMDSKYSHLRIVGWYHSHPDFGIFLSDRDMFIQEHFFYGSGQIAYVVDPVRKLEGVFEWREGKAALMHWYWVGNQIIPQEAAAAERQQKSATQVAAQSTPVADPNPGLQRDGSQPMSSAMLVLSALCLFLVGMLIGEWRQDRQQKILAEGAIAHYGLWNVMQLGRSEQVDQVRIRVSETFDALTTLASEQAQKVDDEERAETRRQFQSVRKALAGVRSDLESISAVYSVPPEQRELLAQVVASHIASLSGLDTRKTLPVPVPVASLPNETDSEQQTPSEPTKQKPPDPPQPNQ